MENKQNYFQRKDKIDNDFIKFITFQEIINILFRRKITFLRVFVISFLILFSGNIFNRILKPQNNGYFTILVEEPIEYESEYGSTFNFEQVSLIQNLAQNKYSPNLPTLKLFLKNDDLLKKISEKYPLTINQLRRKLKITIPMDIRTMKDPPGIYKVEISTKSKKLTSSVLNDLSQIYLDASLELRKRRIDEGLRFLNKQEPILIDKSDKAKENLVSFRIKNGILNPIEEANDMKAKEKKLDDQITALEVERKRLIKAKEEVEAGNLSTKSYEFSINPKVLAISNKPSSLDGGLVISGKNQSIIREVTKLENQLSNARLKYLEDSKIVKVYKKRLDSIMNKFKSNQIDNIITALSSNNSKLNDLRLQRKRLELEFKTNPKLIKEFNTLQQKVSIADSNLKSLFTVQENLQLELAQTSSPWKIIQYPTISEKNLFSLIIQDLILFSFLSLILGIIISFLEDKSTNVLTNSAEIDLVIQKPLLGNFPKLDFSFIDIDNKKKVSLIEKIKNLDNYNGDNKATQIIQNSYKEAAKNFYSSLNLLNQNTQIKKISLTSSIRGEGKTFLSVIIGKVISELDKKVLLIDTDLRGKNISRELNLENYMGIAEFIKDKSKNLNDILKKNDFCKNLDVITAGDIGNDDPAKLLISDRFKFLVDELIALEVYDLIIFDSPPAFYATDNKVISSLCEATLLVISINKVKKDMPKKVVQNIFYDISNFGLIANNYYSNNKINIDYYPYDYYSDNYRTYQNTDPVED